MIYVFEKETGLINRCINAPESEGPLNCNAGEDWVHDDAVVSDMDFYVSNGVLSEYPEKPTEYHAWDWTTKSWTIPNSSLFRAIAQRQSEVNKLRDSKLYSPVEFKSVLFDCDPSSLQNMQGVMARIERGDGLTAGWIGWRTYDNSMVWANSSPEEVLSNLRSIASELENRKQSLLTTSWQHKEAIAMLTSLDQVLAYDTSQGWSV